MSVLVTGGTGLIGKSIQEHISSSNLFTKHLNFIFLSSKDCDLRDEDNVYKLFEKYKPDVVVHLAAKVGGLYLNINSNYEMLIDNIKINTNILEACKKYKVKRLINILSTCVFPEQNEYNNLTYPLSSNQILNGKPHDSNGGYAHAKRLLYIGSELLSSMSNIEVVNLIPTNLYGNHDNYNLYSSHVIPGLIHKLYLAKKEDSILMVKGNGSASRQFVHVDDFARIIYHFTCIELNKKFNCLIVSPIKHQEITIKQLVNKLSKIFDFSNNIVYETDYSNGQCLKTTDSNELLEYIPDFKFTTLQIGLEKTIGYFINNYDSIRK